MAFNSFEEKMLGKIERDDSSEHALLKRALIEARRILEQNKINPSDFRDIFNPNKIAEDLAYVEDMERVFAEIGTLEGREAKKLALIFEGVFHTGAHKYKWLGNGVRVIKTSDVDDLRNGVDGIIEFQKEGSATERLAIGVDVTYSNQLREKFKKIKESIERGELSTIEYFHSGGFKGKLSDIPRVVVGVERRHLIKLCRDIFIKTDEKRLARHPFQILQLKQIRLQL
ncbi:MAG: hypothetical protein Q8R36_03290, partial [bacterium]|nr:hypothetical protein [bacterium]